MYSLNQITKGLREPVLAKSEIHRIWQKLAAYRAYDIGIQGSYWTTNIGDRAIGEIMARYLTGKEYQVRLFSKEIEDCRSDMRILGGGGVLHDWYGIGHLRRRLNFVSKNGAIIGVGVPGLKSKEACDLVKEKSSDISLITVRDDRSRKILESLTDGEIHTTACPSLLYRDPRVPNSGRTGVNFRPWFQLDQETLIHYFGYNQKINVEDARERYIQNVLRICNSVKDPIFIPFHKNDERFAKNNLNIEIQPFEFSVEKTLKRVSSVDQMVTMRYHSLIFATICQKPVLTINYDPKVSSFADRIGVPSYKPHGDIPLRFESISNRSEVRKSAKDNFDYLDEWLARQS